MHPCYLYIFETTSLKNIEHEKEMRQISERQRKKREESERLQVYISEIIDLNEWQQREECCCNGLGDYGVLNAECIAYRISQIGSDYDSDEIPELV